MREVLVLGILIAGLWGSDEARASVDAGTAKPGECRGLVKEIRSFQSAQSVLMRGFVDKNDTLAETLDLYSTQFQKRRGQLKKGDYLSLKQSAEAFRSHAQREGKLVGRFETSSNDLLNQVVQCLENQNSSQNSSASLTPLNQ